MAHIAIGNIDPEKLCDYLTYVSYRHNRNLSPEISPERWAKIFGVDAVKSMEDRFEREQVLERLARQTEELRNTEGDEDGDCLDSWDDGSGLEPHQR